MVINQQYKLKKRIIIERPKAIAIGSSTGGLDALEILFKSFKNRKFDIPVFITQHNLKNFDDAISNKIHEISGLNAIIAKDEEIVVPAIYIAPSGKHLTLYNHQNQIKIKLLDTEPVNHCKPSVDVMLFSLEEIFGGNLIAVILTGIGEDGLQGCKKIAEKGGMIIAQDEQSSVVWGMPKSVAMAGICTEVLPIEKIAECIKVNSFGNIR
jgi:two-component system chemotaxis response regulator CheB